MPVAVRTKRFTPKPANPQADPRFKSVKDKVGQKSAQLKKHPPAKQKANEAAKAAKGPPNEKAAGAKANQVDTLKDTKAETPPPDSFLTVLRAEIDKVMPKNLDESTEFMDGGAESEMKGAVGGNVKDQKKTASGDLDKASKTPPNEGGVPTKQVEAVPPDPNAPVASVDGGAGMPAPKPEAEITEKQTKADAQTAIKENRLDGKRIENKDSRFEAVKKEKGNVDKTADASPNKYRAGEKQTLGKAAAQANVTSRTGMTALTSVKNKSKSAVSSRQDAQKKKDEARRKEVTDKIEGIYKDTKAKVDENLNSLERDVMAIFDSGSASAIASFKANTKREIDDFKDDRYSGLSGKAQWVIDKFKDTPPEIKRIIQTNLKSFTASMDALAVRVAGLVDKRLNKAKADIDGGQAKIKAFVASLPKDLKAVGQEAEKAMESRFNEMRDGVESQKNSLAQKLAEKYKAATDQANELAKQIEEENKGAFKKLADAIGEIIKIILEFKDKLLALLKKAADAIELILDDPIGFLGNLIAAVKQGVNQFVGNIWTHLKAGFMKWLFGSLADAGIEIPVDLSLVSIFKLVMGVLGITYARMRAKAVKILGPTAVAVIEKLIDYVKDLIEGGPAKLWEHVKADIGDLKAMVIDAIQSWLIETIIKQAVIKLLSFFNPAGAFVQAVIAIYNTVVFIIENAAKIMAFVEAVINSVSSIAQGAIGAAANWIEQSLARIIPLVIGFLARLIGLGGISKKIKEFITKVQDKVDKAIDKVLAKIVGVVKKLFGKIKGKKDPKPDSRTDSQKINDLEKALDEAARLRDEKKTTTEKVRKKLPGIKKKYNLVSLDIVILSATETEETLSFEGEVNPPRKKTKKVPLDDSVHLPTAIGKKLPEIDVVHTGKSDSGNTRIFGYKLIDGKEVKTHDYKVKTHSWYALRERGEGKDESEAAEKDLLNKVKSELKSWVSLVDEGKGIDEKGLDLGGIGTAAPKPAGKDTRLVKATPGTERIVIGEAKFSDPTKKGTGGISMRELETIRGGLGEQLDRMRAEDKAKKIDKFDALAKGGNFSVIIYLTGKAKAGPKLQARAKSSIKQHIRIYLKSKYPKVDVNKVAGNISVEFIYG